ncbi:streptodornase A type SdzA [Streptococcus pseudoporcinus]|uniref:Streptodornase A type SdzA n=1 Tax=Streptococcus pseudoporcinus TaxID=361101 RepID=A0A4U9ZKF4_9STRE|nr:DNA/RNA non-specific endonuclease [Streptococcus pseudoporcinus]VTS40529.1 streptodornase A type SdzA [Streptococcus pseudoporcinus]
MKLSKQKTSLLTVVLLLLSLSITTTSVDADRTLTHPNLAHVNSHSPSAISNKILPFTGEYQLQLNDLDNLHRATSSHIQLQDRHETKDKRTKINYDPVGWHNYQFPYGDGTKKAWVMNRGHLVGYQFCGLNDEPRNLVAITTWLNTGAYTGTNDSNPDGMLYYENRLDSWLALHPDFWLDYKVTPIYQGNELLPRQIELQYVGIDSSGKLLPINLNSAKEHRDQNGVTTVVLENTAPNVNLDYLTGTATPKK